MQTGHLFSLVQWDARNSPDVLKWSVRCFKWPDRLVRSLSWKHLEPSSKVPCIYGRCFIFQMFYFLKTSGNKTLAAKLSVMLKHLDSLRASDVLKIRQTNYFSSLVRQTFKSSVRRFKDVAFQLFGKVYQMFSPRKGVGRDQYQVYSYTPNISIPWIHSLVDSVGRQTSYLGHTSVSRCRNTSRVLHYL